MKNYLLVLVVFVSFVQSFFAQEQDSTTVYKKRVLETTEVDFLTSYYSQKGNNASVTGGVGDEKLTDFTPTIVVSLPLNEDDVLTVDAGISAYTSASSSNLDPFDGSPKVGGNPIGSPWVASSGASSQDVWSNINVAYAHSSDDRNNIWNANVSFAAEYDYTSIGFGGGFAKLFNEKNTELSVNAKVYLDTWNPKYPIELDSYLKSDSNLNSGFFSGIDIFDQNGNAIDKSGNSGSIWSPKSASGLINDKGRNSYSVSFTLSQIINKNAQFSLFFDLVQQDGWLANPMQRVYFGDVDNFYMGNPSSINNYTSPTNRDVFQLADDIERLPSTRFKIPVGFRFNQYINEILTLRTYYRYYFDDWGINSHTAEIELPIKISSKFTLYPSYRYYNQTEADYFSPYEENLSTSEFYTSDYDLSEFNANQYGLGLSYTDIFAKAHIWKLGLKSIDLKYNNYKRNTGLSANIISAGFKFIMD
ncbi:Protein of unknown function [Flaviramulus basaltis]|uniref:DUF3570 domain-containing protein n=1 Tax=Flaviramulus basaltis TaxID=369401 RepID=A0A1K2IH75_9FLAO|nr:DUF3570 domain-containing protein [Flaviramulus basaltis]SFZ91804.1 Protein of unknown function [Flaviramulus basaltis]